MSLLHLPSVLINLLVHYLELNEHIRFSLSCHIIRKETTNNRMAARKYILITKDKYNNYPLSSVLKALISLCPLELSIYDTPMTGDILQLLWQLLSSYKWLEGLYINYRLVYKLPPITYKDIEGMYVKPLFFN